MFQSCSTRILNNFKCMNLSLNKSYLLKVSKGKQYCKDVKARLEQKQILQTNLGLSYQRSAALLRQNKSLLSVENKRLFDTIKSLKAIGITSDSIHEYPMLLAIHNNTIEHNMMYLREAGFTYIPAQSLLRFRTLVKKPVSLLKAHNIIPDDIHVPRRLFSYLNPKPDYMAVLDTFNDEDSIAYIHKVIFKHYLVWRLETNMDEVDRVFKIYDNFKYKSFRIISDMIKILNTKLNFSNKKILQHGYLLQIRPESVKVLLKTYDTLAEVDMKTVLFKYPKIIATPAENITTILKYLKDFDISDEAIRKCFEIFTLAPDSVIYRLNELKTIPQFEALIKNVRIVQLVLFQNKAKLRLEHLQKLKVKCASINVLCGSDAVFEKYVQEGNDKTKGLDLVNFLMQELQEDYKVIRQQLSANPNWCHVPLTTVQSTLNYLLQRRMSRRLIGFMPVILLYPREKVEEAMHEVEHNPETYNENLTSRQRLNLCLYFIERKNHFSSNGVWCNSSELIEVSPT